MAVADPIGQARIREDLWVGFGCFLFLQIYSIGEEMWLLVV